jgi:competence protein ComGC
MTHHHGTEAFTCRELLVVILVFVVLGVFLVPPLERSNEKSQRITCVNNLMQIGTAYRIWSNDNGDHFPALTPLTNGGWSEFLSRADAKTFYWTNYVIMAGELGQNPLTLVCPADERKAANTISNLANTNISYFMGVEANDTYPQALLGGDCNLGPGTTPDPGYGFSPADGRGNDVVVTGPVCWSLKMHSRGNLPGTGNILLGDGSAQQATSGHFARNWVKPALSAAATYDKTTNSPGMRLIFP